MKNIGFSPVDISNKEIRNVIKVLRSGWITTGAKTKEFENKISEYCGTEKTVCLNSATVCLDLLLKLFEIGKGDEVITTSYTFCSTANSILHAGAKIIFVDLKKDSFNADPALIEKAITKKTKAVITTDIAGFPVDYDEIKSAIEKKKKLFTPSKKTLQEKLDRPLFISDGAHAFGGIYKGKKIGSMADFTFFSFHATKNLTTAEGGALTFNSLKKIDKDEIYHRMMLLSLHGMSKDAFSKLQAGAWKYSVLIPGYKCNFTDLAAAIGLGQLERYEKEILPKRKALFNFYLDEFKNDQRFILPEHQGESKETSYHLFPLRIRNADEKKRDEVIAAMAEKKISCNVHFIPIIMQPYYKELGYSIKNFPNTYNMYKNEISLPFSSMYGKKTAKLVASALKEIV